jgi:hypothetical protein
MDLKEDKGAPVMISRVRTFNVERFAHRFRARMVGAALLTLLFLCAMIYTVARFLESNL